MVKFFALLSLHHNAFARLAAEANLLNVEISLHFRPVQFDVEASKQCTEDDV